MEGHLPSPVKLESHHIAFYNVGVTYNPTKKRMLEHLLASLRENYLFISFVYIYIKYNINIVSRHGQVVNVSD